MADCTKGIISKCQHVDSECDEPGVVALNGMWLCIPHFEEAMKGIGRTFRTIMDRIT